MEKSNGQLNGGAISQKLEHEAESLEQKAHDHKPKHDESQPAGGFDDTSVPSAPPGYTIKFTFHRASSLPFADINGLSSDPYVLAQLNTKLHPRHKQDPYLRWRTPTIRKCVDPVWNSEWIVANVPSSGFALKARLYDEDPADHDDRLGNVHVHVDRINDEWEGIREHSYKIKKRAGSKRAYLMRGCAAFFSSKISMSGDLTISVENLGRTETEDGGRLWTIGPCNWTRHLSPMIGRMVGTKQPEKKGQAERHNFQASQMQLAGPVPAELYHRYVEFKPFIAGMFTYTSLRGRLLNHALHHQHSRVYNYDRYTVYGSFPSPSQDMTLQFLDLVHYDKGGRIYTYVITLDGQWRFTETGKEFGIDMLSKHTMHSDVNIYVAYSGEFFVRRVKHPHKPGAPDEQPTHPPCDIDGNLPSSEVEIPKDPAYYSLIIDNDSGTYRPNPKLLPQLKDFMERQLPGIEIVILDCTSDKEKMEKWKSEQRERKEVEGEGVVFVQDDGSSISSSEASDLDDQERLATGQPKHDPKRKLQKLMRKRQKAEERGATPPPQEEVDAAKTESRQQ